MSKENYNELKEEMESKVKEQLMTGDAFYDFILFTMNNFIYRYMESKSTGRILVENKNNKLFIAEAIESQIMEALKAINPDTKQGIIELAKTYAKKEGPTVKYSLTTEVVDWSSRNETGKIKASATVNWDYPNFTNKSKSNHKEMVLEFDDLMVFRKEYALLLESICEVF